MGITWMSHGCHTWESRDITWVSRGYHVGITWVSRGCHVGITWVSCGSHMGVTWESRESHMGGHVGGHVVTWSAICLVRAKSLFQILMSIKWHCPKCKTDFLKSKKICSSCKAMTHYRCLGSNCSGLYKNYPRHRAACEHCAPVSVKKAKKRKRIEDISKHEKGTHQTSLTD